MNMDMKNYVFLFSKMVKLRGEVVDHKMTGDRSYSHVVVEEQIVTKKQSFSNESHNDGTAPPSQG